jgi:hypothetical protein
LTYLSGIDIYAGDPSSNITVIDTVDSLSPKSIRITNATQAGGGAET